MVILFFACIFCFRIRSINFFITFKRRKMLELQTFFFFLIYKLLMYNHLFMCGDMFVKLIKIFFKMKYTLILLLCDVTCKLICNNLNFVSISSSLVIFEKAPLLVFIGLFPSLVGGDLTSLVAHIFCGSLCFSSDLNNRKTSIFPHKF